MSLELALNKPLMLTEFQEQEQLALHQLAVMGAEPYAPEVFAKVSDETVLYVMNSSVRQQLADGVKQGRSISTHPSYIISGSFDDLDGGNWRELVSRRSQHFAQGLVPADARLPYAWVSFTGAQAPLIFTPDGLVPDHTRLQTYKNKKMRLSLENLRVFDPGLFVPSYDLSFCINNSSY